MVVVVAVVVVVVGITHKESTESGSRLIYTSHIINIIDGISIPRRHKYIGR